MGASVPDLLAGYRETLVRWGAEREKFGEHSSARTADEVFKQAHAQFKILREIDQGRAGIATLMHDSNPYVVSVAAAHSLLWTPGTAIAALEAIGEAKGVPWQVQVNAKQTLADWRAGRLSFDW